MKIAICLGMILASFTVSAETCADFFRAGTDDYRSGLESNRDAFNHHNAAVNEHRRRNSRRDVVCRDLSLALNSFNMAGVSFESCVDTFEEARTACTGRRLERAMNNMRACSERARSAYNNMQIERGNISRLCTNNIDGDLEPLEL